MEKESSAIGNETVSSIGGEATTLPSGSVLGVAPLPQHKNRRRGKRKKQASEDKDGPGEETEKDDRLNEDLKDDGDAASVDEAELGKDGGSNNVKKAHHHRRRRRHHTSLQNGDPSGDQKDDDEDSQSRKKFYSNDALYSDADASAPNSPSLGPWPSIWTSAVDATEVNSQNLFLWDPGLISIVDRTANDPRSMESLVQTLAAALPEVSLEVSRHQIESTSGRSTFARGTEKAAQDYEVLNLLNASNSLLDVSDFTQESGSHLIWDTSVVEGVLQSPHPGSVMGGGGKKRPAANLHSFSSTISPNSARPFGSTSSLHESALLQALSQEVASAAFDEGVDDNSMARQLTSPHPFHSDETSIEDQQRSEDESWMEWDPDRAERVAQVVEMAESERQRRISEREESTWKARVDRAARIEWAILAYKRHQQSKMMVANLNQASRSSSAPAGPSSAPLTPDRQHEQATSVEERGIYVESSSPLHFNSDYEVICPYSVLGCDVTLRRSELPRHFEECEYRAEVMEAKRQAQLRETYNPLDHIVVCPYSVVGCAFECRRADLPAHLQSCPFRAERLYPVFPPSSLSTAVNETASLYEVVCPNATMGCNVTCLRSQIAFHLQECKFRSKSRQEEEAEREHNRQFAIEAEEEERSRRVSSSEHHTLSSNQEQKALLHKQISSSSSAQNLRHVAPTAPPAPALQRHHQHTLHMATLLKRRNDAAKLESPELRSEFGLPSAPPLSLSLASSASSNQDEHAQLPRRSRVPSNAGEEVPRKQRTVSIGGEVNVRGKTSDGTSPSLVGGKPKSSAAITAKGKEPQPVATGASLASEVSRKPRTVSLSGISESGGAPPPLEMFPRRSSVSSVQTASNPPLGPPRMVRSLSLPHGEDEDLVRSRRLSWVVQAAEIERIRMNEEIIAKTAARRMVSPPSSPLKRSGDVVGAGASQASVLLESHLAHPSTGLRKPSPSQQSADAGTSTTDPTFANRRKVLLENALRRQKLHHATWYPASELAFDGRRTHVAMFHMHMEQQMQLLYQALSDEIETFGRDCAVWERQSQQAVSSLVRKIELNVVESWTKYISKNPPSVHMFGSFASELSVPGVSDLDLVVVPGEDLAAQQEAAATSQSQTEVPPSGKDTSVLSTSSSSTSGEKLTPTGQSSNATPVENVKERAFTPVDSVTVKHPSSVSVEPSNQVTEPSLPSPSSRGKAKDSQTTAFAEPPGPKQVELSTGHVAVSPTKGTRSPLRQRRSVPQASSYVSPSMSPKLVSALHSASSPQLYSSPLNHPEFLPLHLASPSRSHQLNGDNHVASPPSGPFHQRLVTSPSRALSQTYSMASQTGEHGIASPSRPTVALITKPGTSPSLGLKTKSGRSGSTESISSSLIARLRQGPVPENDSYIRNLMRDRLEAARRCRILGEGLRDCKFLHNVKVIDTALVPVISMETFEVPPKLDIDLTIALTNHDGIAAAEFVSMLRLRFPPLMPMVRLLKAFLHSRNLANPFHGGLPSYALVLMATCSIIRSCHRVGVGSSPSLSQGELVLDFLDLFGREFDYKTEAICCNWNADFDKLGMGRSLYFEQIPLLRVSKRSDSLSGNVETVLVVDDPIRFGNNVGRSCFAFHHVQQAFAEVLASLLQQVVKNEALSRSRKSGFGTRGFLLERVFGVKPLRLAPMPSMSSMSSMGQPQPPKKEPSPSTASNGSAESST